MRDVSRRFARTAMAGFASATLLAGPATASADVACNRWNECWRVQVRLDYPDDAGIVFHPDTWATAHHAVRPDWRAARADRGYYHRGVWVSF